MSEESSAFASDEPEESLRKRPKLFDAIDGFDCPKEDNDDDDDDDDDIYREQHREQCEDGMLALVPMLPREACLPFMITACLGGFTRVIRALVKERRVDIGAPMRGETSPLSAAVCCLGADRQVSVIRTLLELGLNVSSCHNESAMEIAVEEGYWDVVDLLCKNGAPPDWVDLTSLDAQATALMLSHGADPSGPPLLYACRNQDAEVVSLLLSAKADVNWKNFRLGNWKTALLEACSVEDPNIAIVEELLQHRAQVDAKNGANRSALSAACKRESVPVVELLLSAKADPNQISGRTRKSLLRRAIIQGNPQLVSALVKAGADRNKVQKDTLLDLVCEQQNVQLLASFLDADDRPAQFLHTVERVAGTGPLEIFSLLLMSGEDDHDCWSDQFMVKACFGCQTEIVRLLLDHRRHQVETVKLARGFNRTKSMFESLQAACREEHSDREEDVLLIVDLLLRNWKMLVGEDISSDLEVQAFDIKVASLHYQEPLPTLCQVARNGHSKIATLLLNSGFDPNVQHSHEMLLDRFVAGISPLMFACWKGHTEMVRILLSAGADISKHVTGDSYSVRDSPYSVLRFAIMSGSLFVIQLLVGSHCNISNADLVEAFGQSNDKIWRFLLSLVPNPSYQDLCKSITKKGNSSLLRTALSSGAIPNLAWLLEACKNGNDEGVAILLREGVCVKGDTECILYYLRCENFVPSLETVQLLMKHGAKVSKTLDAGTGGHPLWDAVRRGSLELVRFFSEQCGCTLKYLGGQTSLTEQESLVHVACSNRRGEILCHLLSSGLTLKTVKFSRSREYCMAMARIVITVRYAAVHGHAEMAFDFMDDIFSLYDDDDSYRCERVCEPVYDWEPRLHSFCNNDVKRQITCVLLMARRQGSVFSLLPRPMIENICRYVAAASSRNPLLRYYDEDCPYTEESSSPQLSPRSLTSSSEY